LKINFDAILGMIEGAARAIPARVKGYVRENWGAPFVAAFMLLLVVAAASLVMGLEFFADGVAVFAYFALVVGVVLQLVCFLKYGKKGGDDD
jgi:heme/copper-type cytochrome/quinol oxidase subunit 4